MKNIESLIHKRIINLKVEIDQNKNCGRWANCLSLSGGISELQGLASDVAVLTSAMHSDGDKPGQFNVRLKTSELPKWKSTSKF